MSGVVLVKRDRSNEGNDFLTVPDLFTAVTIKKILRMYDCTQGHGSIVTTSKGHQPKDARHSNSVRRDINYIVYGSTVMQRYILYGFKNNG